MKQFAVLRKGCLSIDVVREFDVYTDAVAFAELMDKSEEGRYEYFVASDIKSVAVATQHP
jgi:hypothetical protein